MGRTKQYLRYTPSHVFGVVGSYKSNIVWLQLRGQKGRYCAVGTGENVIVWDIRTGERLFSLEGEKKEVTILRNSPDKNHLAVGYEDGSIKIFNVMSGELSVVFSGHKSAVTAIQYDKNGTRLVSGSRDTEVIVWDIVNEAGMFRLRGHKGQITQCYFMKHENFLLTSSKDTFIKFWDLDTQHCFKTVVGHRTEVWDFVVIANDTRLITGSSDNELRLWEINVKEKSSFIDKSTEEPAAKVPHLCRDEDDAEEFDSKEDSIVEITKIGSIIRRGRDRVVSIIVNSTETVVGCNGNDNLLEMFKICTEDEIKKRLKHKQKKARKMITEGKTIAEDEEKLTIKCSAEDEIKQLTAVKLSAKARSFDIVVDSPTSANIIALLNNNSVEEHQIPITNKLDEAKCIHKLTAPGHRTDVRAVCFSSDNTAILSASGESVKVWNRSTLQCIRTMQCGYALCCTFLAGDRHAVVGTKAGQIQMFDIASASLMETIEAHDGAVWSMSLSNDKKKLATGSADKQVKFWNLDFVTEETCLDKKRLTLSHQRTLQMSEEILCVKFSPDGRLFAVSLLDSTVKVFFTDTLKFFLSLYGHKLPVLSLDISSDSTLLASASGDRNIKLWGLDFGDCHKSIFAHDDSIMAVQFIPGTHMFFTCGKDKKVKQWDGDNFEKIITLDGHHAEVWALALSSTGNFVVSASHDKSLRLWEKTQEPLILEEEQEMEREAEYEATAAQGGETIIPGEDVAAEAGLPGKKTVETVKAAERLMEAINLYKEETMKMEEYRQDCEDAKKDLPAPAPNPILLAFGNITPGRYVLDVLKKIKSSEVEEALLVLPFDFVTSLLILLDEFLEKGWEIEYCCRCLFFLMRVHHAQIVANNSLLSVVDKLRNNAVEKVTELKDQVCFNAAGLDFLQQQMQSKEQVTFFADATGRLQQKKKKAKKTDKAILIM